MLTEKLIGLVDLTTLSDDDTPERIVSLVEKAQSPKGNVAAVCIYPPFIPIAKEKLASTSITIATVSNFPKGNNPMETVLADIKASIEAGADEIDVVTPYHYYLGKHDDDMKPLTFLKACRACCGPDITLKAILETGALATPERILQASQDAIEAGIDFLKTSTGKMPIGATAEAADVMMKAIVTSGKSVGFKASGGVRSLADAKIYYDLACEYFGEAWITPERFRFGASGLLDALLNEKAPTSDSGY